MRKFALLVLALGWVGLSVASQEKLVCPTARGDVGQKRFGFTIPFGSLAEAVDLVLKITLHTDFRGHAFLSCNKPCCETLAMSADLLLRAETELDTIPPQKAGFTSVIPVIKQLFDQSPKDKDRARCKIASDWEYTQKHITITLSFAQGLITLPLVDTTGEGFAGVLVSYGCMDTERLPVITSWPRELLVPIGGEVPFWVTAEVPITVGGAPPLRPLLRFEAESGIEGVTIEIEITEDRYEDGKLVYKGEGVVRVAFDAPVTDGQEVETRIRVIDPQGRGDSKPLKLRFVANQPPKAISGGLSLHTACSVWPEYKATDPDLPTGNFGYKLYFYRDKLPSGWQCLRCPEEIFLKGRFLCVLPSQCTDNECWAKDYCQYHGRGCIYFLAAPLGGTAPEGEHVFHFIVFERKGETFGFADSGTWTLTLNNHCPVITVIPSEIKAAPGALLQATVTVTDKDGDAITLTQTSGPGTFAPVEGMGTVSGTWSWTVPEKLRSFSTWVGFVAKDPFDGVGYGFLHVRTLTPPQVHDATALVRRGGRGTAWAYVHDPDSPWVSVHVGSHPGISVIAEVLDDPFAPGMGGFMVAFDVSVDSALCDGDYSIPFTVTDPDGLSAEGALTVHVFGN